MELVFMNCLVILATCSSFIGSFPVRPLLYLFSPLLAKQGSLFDWALLEHPQKEGRKTCLSGCFHGQSPGHGWSLSLPGVTTDRSLILFLISLNCISEFSYNSLSSFVTAILNFLSVISQYSGTLTLVSGELSFFRVLSCDCSSSWCKMSHSSPDTFVVVKPFLIFVRLWLLWFWPAFGSIWESALSVLHCLCQRHCQCPPCTAGTSKVVGALLLTMSL